MGGGSSGLGPILGTVVSGLSNGTASCFIKSLLLARKTVCCVGSGPILLRAIPSQSFELTSNQERTGLVFSRWSSTFSFSLFSGGSLSCCTVHILAAPDARESSSRLQLESTSPALLPLSLSSFLSPPPEPRPCLPGLPSPQPAVDTLSGGRPRRGLRLFTGSGWGGEGNRLLCVSSESGNSTECLHFQGSPHLQVSKNKK